MRKYKPIKIFHIHYGIGYWWGSYIFFFISKYTSHFAIIPMYVEYDKIIYVHNWQRVKSGDTLSWSESRQRELYE